MSIRTTSRVAATLLSLALCSVAVAADVYRWVDERGVTNISDVVPDQYKKVAQKLDLPPTEPDERTRRDAAARSAAIAASAAATSAASPSTAPANRGGPTLSGIVPSRAASSGSPSSSSAGDDCATLQRRYKESQDCFGPQPRTVTGAINGARAPQCPVVVDPSPKCGLPNNGEGAPATGP